ncbi:MAG: hypothetical protein JW761_14085, partial [Prolixibacteraceae bacterium]|nr:hypothetical protein [Prolixibacteraceae bacterium]
MKTTVHQIAASTFIALLLMVINVKAEGTETKASSHATIEATLQLENWMTDETIWNSNWINKTEFFQETEATLVLEDWMTNTQSWNLNAGFAEEIETGLELENWMINEGIWQDNIENE